MIYPRSGFHERMRGWAGRSERLGGGEGQDPCLPPACSAFGAAAPGTRGHRWSWQQGVPPVPPLPQACLGFSCLRQGPGGFSGGGNRGGTFLWGQDARVGDTRQCQGCRSWSLPGRILSGASLTAPQMALVPRGCPDPPPYRGPSCPSRHHLTAAARGASDLGVPAAPSLPAPVSLSPRALPADRLPGKKPRNYKEGRCVSQREGGRGGQECPQRWQMALPRVHCSF